MSGINNWKREPKVGDIVFWISDEYFVLTRNYHDNGAGFNLISIDKTPEKRWCTLMHTWTPEQIVRNSEFICEMPNILKILKKINRKEK